MQLKHIEHPEDTILTGDLSAINWFTIQGKVSLKIDGCPAIVWGTNPENDKFFVGTKSVFNKSRRWYVTLTKRLIYYMLKNQTWQINYTNVLII